MSKNFRETLGSVGANLYEVMAAIVQTNDLAAAGQIKTFKEIVLLVQNSTKEGLDPEFILKLISAFRQERAALTSGEVEMAGAASTGFETADGKSLKVDFNAGGSLAGFALGLTAGYENHDQKSSFERSSQNFRILARWAVAPADLPPELMAQLVTFVAKPTPGVNPPALPESFNSPYLEAIRDVLPVLKEVMSKKTE